MNAKSPSTTKNKLFRFSAIILAIPILVAACSLWIKNLTQTQQSPATTTGDSAHKTTIREHAEPAPTYLDRTARVAEMRKEAQESESQVASYQDAIAPLNEAKAQRLKRASAIDAKCRHRLVQLANRVIQSQSETTGQPSNYLSIPHLTKVNAQGSIQVYVHTDGDPTKHINDLENSGMQVELAVPEMNVVQGWIAATRLGQIAKINFVNRIGFPSYVFPRTGSVTSEGDVLHRADDVRALAPPGPYTGSGVKIGLFTDSATDWADAVASGNLPSGSVTFHPTLIDPGNHATSEAEIIYDLAPGVEFFIAGPETSAEAVTAVQWLVSQGCHVIGDASGFPSDPWFEDSVLAQEARSAVVDDERVFVSAAGNDADEHYQGNYAPAGTSNFHDFKAGTATDSTLNVLVRAGDSIAVVLQWNDRWGASGNDYDLLLGDAGTIVDSSTATQNGNDDPLEYVYFQNTSGVDKQYDVLVSNYLGAAPSRILELYVLRGITVDDDRTSGDSIYGAAAVAEVISVGAVAQSDPGLDDIEVYSSRGPSTISFPVAETRLTPTIVAVTRVSVSGAGGSSTNFAGTSAAAPHIVGICALMLDKNPTATPAEIRSALIGAAADRGAFGFDYVFGHGLADALESVNLTNDPPVPQPAPLVSPRDSETLVELTPTLMWHASANADNYKLHLGSNNPPTNIVNGMSLGNVTEHTLPTLQSYSTYYWQVVPENTTGPATGCPVGSFTTGPDTSSWHSLLAESFDAFPSGIQSGVIGATSWENAAGDDGEWTVDSAGTPSLGTGPSADHPTGSGNYLFTEASSGANPGFPGKRADLVTPVVNLPASGGAMLIFWYHMLGTSMGTLHVDVYSGGVWVEDVMVALDGEAGSNWFRRAVDLSAFSGSVRVRFRGVTGSGFTSDMAIDNVSILSSVKADYAAWIDAFEGLGVLTGFSDDPDGDGNANGLENYFGTHPNVWSTGLAASTLSGNTFSFTHPINDTPASDVSASYRWSTDLQNFNDDGDSNGVGTTVSFTQDSPSGGMVTVTAVITGIVPESLFVDIEVRQTP